MTSSIAKKQNYLYICFIIITFIVTVLIYRISQKKWLFFREAEYKFQEKEFKEAIDLYQKSLSIDVTSPIAFVHLADSYVAMGNFSEAIKWYRAYLKLYPYDATVRHSLARSLSWNGNIKEAQKEYQTLLQVHEVDKIP